jgi:hypothetical protein
MSVVTRKATTNQNVLQRELIQKHYKIIARSLQNTALAILHTAQCVSTAKRELNAVSFKSLASRLGGESKLSKLITIGERADALKIHVNVLPNSWTSLYHLSRLDSHKLDKFVASGKINHWMTGASAQALLNAPPPSAAANLISIIVKSDDKTHRALREHRQDVTGLFRDLKSICDQLKTFGVTVKDVMQDIETATKSDAFAA